MDSEIEQNDTHPNGDEVTGGAKSTMAVKIRVTDIEWLQNEAGEGESRAAALSRLRDELLTRRDEQVALKAAVAEYSSMISQLESDIEDLHSQSQTTTLTSPAGQSTFSDFGGDAIRETMDAVKDVCDDETVCIKTALHMIDTKADVMGKQLDRDHTRDEKEKDRDHAREEKEKDRKLKQDLETSRADHQKNLAMIKRGIVREEDLEGVVFLGSTERKTAGERLADMKNRAHHAADAEGDDFVEGEEFVEDE